jgi:palmitoyltransferase
MAGRPGYITLPIISVLAAIGYVYYTTVFLAIPAWLGLATAAGVANAAAYTALAVACVVTYGLAITRDPGRVPPAFVPDVEDAETPIHEIKRKVRPCIPSSCAGRDRPTRSRCKDWIFGATGMQN